MNNLGKDAADSAVIDAVLIGGPGDLPETERSRRTSTTQRKIKIMHRGGYEHFELVSEVADPATRTPAIFHWAMRTEIAE